MKLIQGGGIKIIDDRISNGIQISTADEVIVLNDVLANGNNILLDQQILIFTQVVVTHSHY